MDSGKNLHEPKPSSAGVAHPCHIEADERNSPLDWMLMPTRRITYRVQTRTYTITCPHCRHAFRNITAFVRGVDVRCDSCGRTFRTP
jgi:ribosomal protein S27E